MALTCVPSDTAVLACPCSPSEVSLHKSVYIKEYGSGRLCDYNSGRNCHHSDHRGKMWWERSEAVELPLEKAYTSVGSGLPRDGNRAEILRPVNGAEVLRDLACVPPQWGVSIPGFKFLNFGYLKLLLSCAHWDFQSLLNVERVPGIKTLSVKKVGVVTSCIALPGRSFERLQVKMFLQLYVFHSFILWNYLTMGFLSPTLRTVGLKQFKQH